MANKEILKVALVGNPNTGKTSLFNRLTGLNQKVGNYPGITVEKKTGKAKLSQEVQASIIDLPGTYSLHPTSLDEQIVLKSLMNDKHQDFPDVVVVVTEIENLKRNLLLFTQIQDLGLPSVLAINMSDQMSRKGISLDLDKFKLLFGTEAVLLSTRKNVGVEDLKQAIIQAKPAEEGNWEAIQKRVDAEFFAKINAHFVDSNSYRTWLQVSQNINENDWSKDQLEVVKKLQNEPTSIKKMLHKETVLRYQKINQVLKETYTIDKSIAKDLRSRLDKILTHKIFGYLIFAAILLTIFQSIYDWATIPMDWIDAFFGELSANLSNKLPQGMLTDLLTEGIIPGIGGIVIFIPQIAILFMFVAILEETGYMSRVVFLMDKIMRKYGMSGKSVVPLISGTACAIPAIMATRNIVSWKERLITILVTPFITCSARLPVYAIMIALVVPEGRVLGFLSLQGLTLLGLYLLGFFMALASGFILHKTLKISSRSFFVIEMPNYKLPSIKNVFYTVVDKTKAFVIGAGKIILAISIVLWFLASNGLSKFNNAEAEIAKQANEQQLTQEETDHLLASYKLEHSFVGMMGKSIEPAIKPLGYDWKVGIALVSSFAAREVFVGTLATIYSVGNDDEDTTTIKQRMAAEINQDTGEPLFNLAVGMSLMVFYAFAMQCMSTLAIVKRETNSWKWPLLQLFGMGFMAYIAAYITFIIFS